MTSLPVTALSVTAPAKLNLYLHVTGRRDDGYHLLDSLVGFTAFGDDITLTPSKNDFALHITGPFAPYFKANETISTRDSANIITQAVWRFCDHIGIAPDFTITVRKNLPLAAGLGGGSANAAAAIKAILHHRGLNAADIDGFDDMLLSLGADVPVCFHGKPCHMSGIGEIIRPVPPLPPLSVLLVNPLLPCPTAQIFRALNGNFTDAAPPPPLPSIQEKQDKHHFVAMLRAAHNDLQQPAMAHVPAIGTILNMLERTPHCLLARMSGSGASCFALYANHGHATGAAAQCRAAYPDFWVQDTILLS